MSRFSPLIYLKSLQRIRGLNLKYEQIFNVNNDKITLNIYQYNNKGESAKMYNKI